ncbi:ABC transporter permease, partial [Pseudomonas qingdaonensis]
MPLLSDAFHPRFAQWLLRRGALLAFAAILLAFALSAPNFLTPSNLVNVLAQSAILGSLAFGL